MSTGGATRRVRSATVQDAARCAEIYAPYVTDTAVSLETVPPTPEQMARRIAVAVDSHAWLVLTEEDRVVGYAYAGPHRARPGYRWSCEASVYLEPGRSRTGGGRALYEALFARLAARGYRTVLAGTTLPNEASVGLHAALGFERVGVFRRIGWKHGRWHDVAWAQRELTADAADPGTDRHGEAPAEPR